MYASSCLQTRSELSRWLFCSPLQVPIINQIRNEFDIVVISYDWHPHEQLEALLVSYTL